MEPAGDRTVLCADSGAAAAVLTAVLVEVMEVPVILGVSSAGAQWILVGSVLIFVEVDTERDEPPQTMPLDAETALPI